ncbi:MAG: arabinose 5-phosphate isomerase KdsD [Gammaproteobacteria bacterium]|jgi:arabinose-5-phosphate isomerase|nr:MAG: KpsF/GutQ family sugar-phosphate isomerase [Gammaproteobacteria bacterium TMED104]GIR06734.1 MAG: arabinose 5-phosphate isomerase KdsD [Gammaproteobacteria bacterium]|tara:strand:+ start:1597 stop:2562 length:966 start_codon:yes stop_codon:yes gene_type:complete
MSTNKFINSAKKTIGIQADSIASLSNQIDKSFAEIAKKVSLIKGKLIVMGVGKSGHVGQKVSATLASTGTPSFFIHPTEAAHGDLGMIAKDDAVLIFSNSGETKEVTAILPALKRMTSDIFSITGNANSSIAKASSVHLKVQVEKEACPHDLAPTSSTTASMVIGDALAISLIEEKNFSSEDFAKSHPAGELGKKLTTYVGDLAISGNKVSCVEIDASIKDTIIEITSKKLGMALVVKDEEVVGIFTDGDLRRALNQEIDIENNSVSSVMTKKFISISENDLAIDAATLMEKNKIFTLNVLNQKKQPSVITMHQLLEFGII